jgi:hypothetical protein
MNCEETDCDFTPEERVCGKCARAFLFYTGEDHYHLLQHLETTNLPYHHPRYCPSCELQRIRSNIDVINSLRIKD